MDNHADATSAAFLPLTDSFQQAATTGICSESLPTGAPVRWKTPNLDRKKDSFTPVID